MWDEATAIQQMNALTADRESLRQRAEDAETIALSLAEALESAKPVYAGALNVAIRQMESGKPWSEEMAVEVRAVVTAWCEQANAALSSPILNRLRSTR